jgi:hypothetical protein
MTFQSYWSGIIRKGRPGSPSLDEARRDFRDALGRVIIVRYS